MVGKKIIQGQVKVREFYFVSGMEEIFGVTVFSTLFFLNEGGKFV